MTGVILRPGEGEPLFGGRILVKADFAELSITESHFSRARPGAEPHIHREHVDSFYVLDGGMAFLVHDEEVEVGPGTFVSVPPEVVHGFRSTSEARFLNFHTPDRRFADHIRERDRGEPGGFDSFDAEPGTGIPGTEAVVLRAGEGERLEAATRVATIKAGRDELALIEFELEPAFEGPDPHTHREQVDAFYVLEGEAEFLLNGERLLLGAGSFVAAPPGVEHTFTSGPGQCRLVNVHAPSAGFHDGLRKINSA